MIFLLGMSKAKWFAVRKPSTGEIIATSANQIVPPKFRGPTKMLYYIHQTPPFVLQCWRGVWGRDYGSGWHAIGGCVSEQNCGHGFLCRDKVSILRHIQGEVNVIHKLDCHYYRFLSTIPAVKIVIAEKINVYNSMHQTKATNAGHLTTCTSSHLALWLVSKKNPYLQSSNHHIRSSSGLYLN